MNQKDLRVLKASNLPSDDSGSDGEENLRVARSLKVQEQHLDGVTVFWPSFCKVLTSALLLYISLRSGLEI